jgi:hypothetical protein
MRAHSGAISMTLIVAALMLPAQLTAAGQYHGKIE